MMKLSQRAWQELGIAPPYHPAFLDEASLNVQSGLTLPAQDSSNRSVPKASSVNMTGAERPRPSSIKAEAHLRSPSNKKPMVPASVRSPENLAEIAKLGWDRIEQAIEACSTCTLHQTRSRIVPGVGDHQATWLFVGEAPGAEEDQRGEPFVGPAGILLDSMLAALNLSRTQDVYIANVMKCRPPDNRTPVSGECHACMPYLERQITLLQPKIIVALGKVAAQSLLNSEINLGSLRNKVHAYGNIPLIVTFHPAYLLRNMPEKAKAWADLCLAKKTLDQA
jgi:DNA polymerase